VEQSPAASTNTQMLMAKLRPLWEQGRLSDESGVIKMTLLDRGGNKVACDISVPQEKLRQYLKERIEKGIRNFFIAMEKAFADDMPGEIHVLLAGNASRSEITLELFGLQGEKEGPLAPAIADFLKTLFKKSPPRIVAHPPLPRDEDDLYRPTAKTGVALGLLRLCPGEPVKLVDYIVPQAGGDAPFGWYVGCLSYDKFKPGLRQGDAYHVWTEIGVLNVTSRVFNMFYSSLPMANTGEMTVGDGLYMKQFTFAGDPRGQKVFARIVGPARIELCTAPSPPQNDRIPENLREFEFQ
jgi:hypothetical protein